jgi:hypothetical protein
MNELEFGTIGALKTSVDMTKRLEEQRVDHRITNPSFYFLRLPYPNDLPLSPTQPVLRASTGHATEIVRNFPSGFHLMDR